jgi:hypothetical protein
LLVELRYSEESESMAMGLLINTSIVDFQPRVELNSRLGLFEKRAIAIIAFYLAKDAHNPEFDIRLDWHKYIFSE